MSIITRYLSNGDDIFQATRTEVVLPPDEPPIPPFWESWIIYGKDGDDDITGGALSDTINGGNDEDTIDGGAGRDRLLGERDSDSLDGGKDSDILDGGEGDDWLYGGEGNDHLFGGSGNDSLVGHEGNDFLYGDDGLSQFYFDVPGADQRVERLDDNDQLIPGLDFNDLLRGGKGNDFLFGEIGRDTLYGDADNDYLDGGAGGDQLYGGTGNDTLIGNDGWDTLVGVDQTASRPGLFEIDILQGDNPIGSFGVEKDLFVLGETNKLFYDDGNIYSTGIFDYALIKDFDKTEDSIQLTKLPQSGIGSQPYYWLGSSPIAGVQGTAIYYDDGISGGLPSELIAIVQVQGGTPDLDLSDSYFVYV